MYIGIEINGNAKPGDVVIIKADGTGGTFHDYGREEPAMKIDYIFVGGEARLVGAERVADKSDNGVYYSDHFAITATFEL